MKKPVYILTQDQWLTLTGAISVLGLMADNLARDGVAIDKFELDRVLEDIHEALS